MRRQPKIGVALGSGGARGWAHIGVLEGLGAVGIFPDVVAGSSIGALVGAAYITGKLPQLKARMENFGRRDIATMLDVHVTTGGLIEGKRTAAFLDGLGIAGDIKSFPYRYGAVAASLASGREIWLESGPIGHAVRASIGVPGVFSPTKDEEGGWLLDGGLVNPVPVSLARAMGAEIVIAVDLSAGLARRRFGDEENSARTEWAMLTHAPQWLKDALTPVLSRVVQPAPDFPSYFEVMASSLNIMQDRISRMRLAGDPPDVLLTPQLPDFTWLDFHRAKEAIAEGLACVEHAKPLIDRYCRSVGMDNLSR
jgi:NTE family protein